MTFRILTANLFSGRAQASGVQDLVERFTPDVMAVQELTSTLEPTLCSLFAHGAVASREKGDGIGLFSSRPTTIEILPLASHQALVGRVEDQFEVIAVHLPAPQIPPPWKTFRQRAADIAALEEYFSRAPTRARVLVGDLNSSPAWPAYRRLRRYLEDGPELVARRNGSRPARSWGPWPGSPRLLRIDHVLVSGLEPTGAEVVPVPGSDHSALVVDFAL